MKKNYILVTFFTLSVLFATAQNVGTHQHITPDEQIESLDNDGKVEPGLHKKQSFNSKAFGDTIAFFDFANSIPLNWRIVNNNANNFQWTWDTIYQPGQFSLNTPAINSTSAANGFLSLPSDFYNTPTPPTGRVTIDTYIESDVIDLTNGGLNPGGLPSVWVSYQQYVRFCCSGANRLVIQVSTDNFATNTEYDAINNLAVNASNTGTAAAGQTNIINISTAAANSPNCKIRILAVHSGRYYWMIDDFAVIEGVENDLELNDPYMEFNEANYTWYPFYGQIPYDLFPPLPLFGRILNNGSNTQTNVRLEADITHTALPTGGAGLGLIYSTSMNTNPSTVVSTSVIDTAHSVLTPNPRFIPLVLGDFQVDFLATGDSVDGNLGNETAVANFSTTDTIFARDDGLYGGGTGPASYVRSGQPGGTAVGDRFGTMYIVESRTGNGVHTIPTSVTYGVSLDVRNIGVEIVPKIWAYNDDTLTNGGGVADAFGAEVASSFIPYTVAAADTNTLLTLAFDNGPAYISGLDSGQWVVGWEVTSIAGGTTFEVYNDATTAALQSNVTSFNYHGHSPGWGWVDVNPIIRLNLANLPVSTGIKTSSVNNVDFQISPNPNNGTFNLAVTATTPKSYSLVIRNTIGQTVYNEILNINGSINQQVDLSKFEKGVYLISLENEDEKLVKKVITR